MIAENLTDRRWSPNWAVHPGEILEEHLEARGFSQAEFARLADLTPKLVSTIIAGKNPVSPESAIAFERVLGLKSHVWTNLQAEWDLHQSKTVMAVRAEEPKAQAWVDQFPLKELRRRGVLPATNAPAEILHALLRFFGVATIEAYESRFTRLAVQYRHSPSHQSDPACLRAWLQLGEIQAQHLAMDAYDEGKFREALKGIRALTREDVTTFYPKMVSTCAAAGVALVAVKPLPKTRLSGAARWISPYRAMIMLSLRHKTNDHFWFSFFHEAAHILLHARNVIFADDEAASGGEHEAEADAFAEETLVGRDRFQAFRERKPNSHADVQIFADEVGVHPGIVVGMLQHHGDIHWSRLNDMKAKFAWSDEVGAA